MPTLLGSCDIFSNGDFGNFKPVFRKFGIFTSGNFGIDTDGRPPILGREISTEGITGAFNDLISGKFKDFVDSQTSLGLGNLLIFIPLSLITPVPIAVPTAMADTPPTRGFGT